ncbi:MAG: methylated-DNA--[protein]-cysteine S-methyltransferase [Proteobacteria bacterium]|nr:methylated-DNA--[protein]-cysteine S-methyltransferase [Pseudomonadota bacterium]
MGSNQEGEDVYASRDRQWTGAFRTGYLSPLGPVRILGRESSIVEVGFCSGDVKNWRDSGPDILFECLSQLDEYFRGKREKFNLTLAPQGTTFQKRVWRELLRIPYGETRSYKQIARNLGNGQAARPVGGANARNPISIIIPCHRVIGTRGDLVGYGGGLRRKKWLLNHEKEIFSGSAQREAW